MLHAHPSETSAEDVDDGRSRAGASDSVAVVPLTIPLLTGPATISTMAIDTERSRGWRLRGVLVLYGS